MVSVEVKGLAKLRREIDRLKKRSGMGMGEFADYSAKIVRDTVVRNAQPFGLGKKSRELGEKAIRRDLFKIFRIVPESARKGRGVITNAAEAKRWHATNRGQNGRTKKTGQRPIVRSVFQSYLKEVQGRVGMAKGALVAGDPPRLKGRFQGWVMRSRNLGSSRRRRSPFGAMWKFAANPRHVASPRVMGERGVNRVMMQKERNLLRALQRREKAILRQAERRINQG